MYMYIKPAYAIICGKMSNRRLKIIPHKDHAGSPTHTSTYMYTYSTSYCKYICKAPTYMGSTEGLHFSLEKVKGNEISFMDLKSICVHLADGSKMM